MELVQKFAELWEPANASPDVFSFVRQQYGADSGQLLAVLVFDQQRRWRTEHPLRVEDYLLELPALPADMDWKLQLAVGEFQARVNTAQPLSEQEISSRFSDIGDTLRERLRELTSGDQAVNEQVPQQVDAAAVDATKTQTHVHRGVGSKVTYISSVGIGVEQKGRYRLDRVLGEGAFGRVYLGYDEELQRQVAIKVPTKARFQKPEDAEDYLAEARMVASLDHPHIVPVYDMGRTLDDSIYVVSKFIAGSTLEGSINAGALPQRDAAKLLATIAPALQHAHQRRLIHRDIKPANILIEENTNTPYVADFGLAVREEEYLKHSAIAGTPAYMSPEQARGEGHRLDGRSDIFSLGVMLYEVLTGKKPFRGSSTLETLNQVISVDPKPPRELVEAISPELERICLKALSKRASDRYATAAELADDLQQWLQPAVAATQTKTTVQVVPKGLRSFDAGDADFFLDLLPGTRNRDGLPESIAFWKKQIEQTDAEQIFSVGLIYGPSGCGKSSLVKAGLLPHLSADIVAVYVEATPIETETRILRGLRKQIPDLSDEMGLTDTLAALRRGQGHKAVIIIDQFEQWLHAHRAEADAELVKALRQCDGGQLQAIVMVRDDFAMAASRFMRALDTRILEGHNFATVDLFDIDHAAKVLTKFGQAFGKLPANAGSLSADEQQFISQVAEGMAQEGKVVSVRLSLFADMVKNKAWKPVTLEQVGGTQGIGVNFLEETFSSREANPDHRLHAVAARGVLRALLPELGTDIKGNMRSQTELLKASGYQDQTAAFADLLRILDGELRLITPTDPEGHESQSKSDSQTQYYQLTHDYLVPSFREWLTRKQRETRRGRAELKLAERTAGWSALRESKQLPTLWEWLNIGLLTDSKSRTEPERSMMNKATQAHGLRMGFAVAGLIAMTAIGSVVRNQVVRQQEATRIEGLVGRLVSAEPNQLPGIVEELGAQPELAAIYLSPLLSADETLDEKRAQLHARLATVSRDPSLVDPLFEELLNGKLVYVGPIRQQLQPSAAQLTEKFRDILRSEKADVQRRFRAALALADYVPEAFWTEPDLQFIAEQLVSSNSEFQPLLREYLRPIHSLLLSELERIFADAAASDSKRLSAANAFAAYAADDVVRLSRLLSVATPEQDKVLYPIVAASPTPAIVDDLSTLAATGPADELGSGDRVPFGQRRANAAVTLLRLGEREKVLSVFEVTDDPEALTQFIFRCRPRDVRVDSLLDCLRIVSEAPLDRYPRNTRYALLLALGKFPIEEIDESLREPLLQQLADWYRHDPSSGVHGAAGWLLRQWGQAEIVREVDQTAVPYSLEREWFTLAITVTPTSPPKAEDEVESETSEEPAADSVPPTDIAAAAEEGSEEKDRAEERPPEPAAVPLPPKTFYYTFIVFPGGESTIGSVADEPDRSPQEYREQRHVVKFTRAHALLDREVTFEELIAFSPDYEGFMQQSKAQPSDAGFNPHWYDSVGFCRWLTQQSGLSEAEQSYDDPKSLDKEQYPRELTPDANWAPRDWPLELGRHGFRLPTDSEWEAASRAGSRTTYGYGSDVSLLGGFGWFTENSGKHVHPPRELCPSVRGLFDLHGNLYEWSHDWHEDFGSDALTDPLGPKGGSSRVRRGGSWVSVAAYCESAFRSGISPAHRMGYNGFRLALSSPSGVTSAAAQVQEAAQPGVVGTEGAQAEPRPELP